MSRTTEEHNKQNRGCAVQSRHITSKIEAMKYNRGTLSVQLSVCSAIETHYLNNQGCPVLSRHIINKIGVCSTIERYIISTIYGVQQK